MIPEVCLPITVIVPTYNDGSYLGEALSSILSQSTPPEMLVVVDDGSATADAEEIVTALKAENNIHTQIVYLKQSNQGPSAARNAGLKLALTPYVAFLDADDRMLASNLATMWQALNELADDYFGVYGTYCDLETGKPYPFADLDGCIAPDKVGKKGGVAGGVHTYLFRTYHLKSVGGFDESLVNNEDFDLIIRLLRTGLKCKGKVTTCFEKRNRMGSLSRPWEPLLAFNNTLRFLQKAEKSSYFTDKELVLRRRSTQMNYAKLLMKQGKEKEAVNIWHEVFKIKPSSIREFYHWVIYQRLRFGEKIG